MWLQEELLAEIEEVINLLTPLGLWHTFHGGDYDVWVIKIKSLLRSPDLWHFVQKGDPIDPNSLKTLTIFKKYIRKVVSLSLTHESID